MRIGKHLLVFFPLFIVITFLGMLGAAPALAQCTIGTFPTIDGISQTPSPVLVWPAQDCACQNISVTLFDADLFVWNYELPLGWDWDGVPATFVYTAELREAIEEPNTGAILPGPLACTATLTITAPRWCETCMEPNHASFNQQILFEDCPCAAGDYPYFLYVTTSGSGPAQSMPYVHTGGNTASVVAQAGCCFPAVPEASDSWGSVKAIYR